MLYHLSNNLDYKNSTIKLSTVRCVMQGGDITLAQFVAGPDDTFSPLYILFFQASLEVEWDNFFSWVDPGVQLEGASFFLW